MNHRAPILFISLISLCTFGSCKKDKLTGEYANLVGKWEVYKTEEASAGFVNTNYEPGNSRTLEFKEKGKYVYRDRNGEKTEDGRILVSDAKTMYYDYLIEFKNISLKHKSQYGEEHAVIFNGNDTLHILGNCLQCISSSYRRI